METPSALYSVCRWFNAFFIAFFFLHFYEEFALDIHVIFIVSHPCSQILGVLHIWMPIWVIPSGLMIWLHYQFRAQTQSVYLISCSELCAAHPGLLKLPEDSPLHGSTARHSICILVAGSIWNMGRDRVIKNFRIWSEIKNKRKRKLFKNQIFEWSSLWFTAVSNFVYIWRKIKIRHMQKAPRLKVIWMWIFLSPFHFFHSKINTRLWCQQSFLKGLSF